MKKPPDNSDIPNCLCRVSDANKSADHNKVEPYQFVFFRIGERGAIRFQGGPVDEFLQIDCELRGL